MAWEMHHGRNPDLHVENEMRRQEEQNTEWWQQFRRDKEEFIERLDEGFEAWVRERADYSLRELEQR